MPDNLVSYSDFLSGVTAWNPIFINLHIALFSKEQT